MKRNLFAAFTSIFIISFATAFELHIPSIEPVFTVTSSSGEKFHSDNLTGKEIIQISMLFGLQKEHSENYDKAFEKYNKLKGNLAEKIKTAGSEEEAGEQILLAMYEQVLSTYRLNQTKVDEALLSGTYNCVSASLLYLALAVDFGFDARVQETQKHAFITFYTSDGKSIDVETTNPFGFNPGTKKTVSTSGNSKKYATIPKNYYSNRKEISRKRAVTLVAKNLCSFLNDRDDYVTAIPLAAAALEFVENEKEDARADFELLCGNFAVFTDKKNADEAGLDFLEDVFAKYGKSDYLLKQYEDITFNSMVSSCNQNQFEESRKNLGKRRLYLSEAEAIKIENNIHDAEVLFKAKTMTGDEAIVFIQNERKLAENSKNRSMTADLRKIEEVHWSKKIDQAFKKSEYLVAVEICDEGLKSIPESIYLKNTREQSLQNHGINFHNKIVPLVNQKRFAEAKEILEAALKDNPQNKTLLNDLKRVNERLK